MNLNKKCFNYIRATSFYNGFASVTSASKYKTALIDKTLNPITPFKYWHIGMMSADGLAYVIVSENRIDKYGFIDKQGNEVIPPKYNFVSGFEEGRCFVHYYASESICIIDTLGNELFCFKEKDIGINSYFYNEFCILNQNGKLGLLNKNCEFVIPTIYEDVHEFEDDFVAAKLNGKWGYLDKCGNIAIPFIYEESTDFFKGLATAKINNKWIFIDKAGNEILSTNYDEIYSFSSFYEENNFTVVMKDNKYGLINREGVEVHPCIYEEIVFDDYGFMYIKQNGKWGLLNQSAEQITPCKFEEVEFVGFKENRVGVKFNNKWGYVDMYGEQITPFIYDDADNFNDGFAAVKLNELWGFVDTSGNQVVPCIFEKVGHFAYGYANVAIDYDKWGYISKNNL